MCFRSPTLSYLSLLLVMSILVTGCKKSATPTPTAAPQTSEAVPAVEKVSVATYTPPPTATSRPTMPPTSTPTATPPTTPTTAPTDTPTPTATATPEPTATPTPGLPPLSSAPQPPKVLSFNALTLLDDVNIAPPLSVHVSANQALDGYKFRVSGTLRNDAAENYAGLGVVATFYTSNGSRYGPIKAAPACLLLAPGDECPFVIEATSKGLVSVMLHPEGYPTSRGAARLTFNVTGRYQDAVGFVHLTGQVRNPNPFAVKNVTVNGALLNARGEIVAVGMAMVIDPIASKGSATFDVAIEYVPYANYRLYVHGEPQ